MAMTIDEVKQVNMDLLHTRDFVVAAREDTSIIPPSYRMTYADAQEYMQKAYDKAIADHFSDVNVDIAEGMIEDNCSIDFESASVEWPDGRLDMHIYYIGNCKYNALESVQLVKYKEQIGSMVINMNCLFNDKVISEEVAIRRLRCDSERDIIVVSELNYESVFNGIPHNKVGRRGE